MLENGGISFAKPNILYYLAVARALLVLQLRAVWADPQGFRPLFVLVEVVMVAEVTAPVVLAEEADDWIAT